MKCFHPFLCCFLH